MFDFSKLRAEKLIPPNICLRVSKTHFQQNLIFDGFLKEWIRFIACYMNQ